MWTTLPYILNVEIQIKSYNIYKVIKEATPKNSKKLC